MQVDDDVIKVALKASRSIKALSTLMITVAIALADSTNADESNYNTESEYEGNLMKIKFSFKVYKKEKLK